MNADIGNSLTAPMRPSSVNTQVTDNLRDQHQRDKQDLSELNDRFRGYLDRVKVLENRNCQLTDQLHGVSKSWGSASQAIIGQYGPPLDHLRDKVNLSMTDEIDLQMSLRRAHQTVDTYRSLIHDETVWTDKCNDKRQRLKCELDNSIAELSSLQISYKQVEEQVKSLLKQRNEQIQDIDQLNERFYHATMDRFKSDLHVQTLREEIPFLSDLHAHVLR
jgi:chromosome segregation ATPase